MTQTLLDVCPFLPPTPIVPQSNLHLNCSNVDSPMVQLADAPNKLLIDMLFDNLKKLHDKELNLSPRDCMSFLQSLCNRPRDGASYPLPLPSTLCKSEEGKIWMQNSTTNNSNDSSSPGKCDSSSIPMWRCFLKGISITHVMLTFVPASFSDVKKLMITEDSIRGQCSQAVRLVLPQENDVLEAERKQEELFGPDIPILSRSSSGDTSYVKSVVQYHGVIGSGGDSPIQLSHRESSSDTPFRMRASSWDTISKRWVSPEVLGRSLNRIRTGSMDSKMRRKRPLTSPVLQLLKTKSDSISLGKNINRNLDKCIPIESQHNKIDTRQESKNLKDNFMIATKVKERNNKNLGPVTGSVTFPIYVYDCPLALLMEVLVYGDGDFHGGKDLFEDHTFKFENTAEKENQNNSERYFVDSVTPDLKSEVTEILIVKQTLQEHCIVLQLAYSKCFVFSLFEALQHDQTIYSRDVHAAVNQCEEALIEIDISEFIKTVCGHLKEFQTKVRIDGLKHFSTNKIQTEIQEIPAFKRDIESPILGTFHSDKSLLGNNGSPSSWDVNTTVGEALSSGLTNLDSDKAENKPSAESLKQVSPLFLHLTCSVHYHKKMGSCSVKLLPTCLGEIWPSFDPADTELDLKELVVTLDIVCITLPQDIEAVVSEKAQEGLRSTSFCSTSSIPQDEDETIFSQQDGYTDSVEQEEVLPEVGDNLQHLPAHQHKAVATCIEEIQWLMKDEIASFLLDIMPLKEDTLKFVADHVCSSPGRSSCLMEKVPLQFVFGPDQSMERFTQEFQKLTINHCHLRQEGQFYYLVRDKRSSIRKKPCSLIPPLGIKCMYTHLAENQESWKTIRSLGCPFTTASSDENMNADHENLMSEDFPGRHIPERYCVPSHCNLEDSDTDDEAQTCKKQPHKQKHLSSQPVQLIKLSDIQNCGAGSPWHESISLTASPSLSLTAQDNQNRSKLTLTCLCMIRAILDDCSNTLLKRSQSCGVERETTSPTRWYANTWQKRQLSTPCYKSEVSSVVESVHGTEDGYEGDSSNSEEECDWLLDLEMHCPMMPSFWLIMALHNEDVTIYFHCRSPPQEVGESESYLAVQKSIVVCIKDLCKLVNQTLLLQSLHDSRICEPLLEPESSEDSWQVVVAMSLDHNYTRLKSVDGAVDGERQATLLEVSNRFPPGWFACSVVWETHFFLHPRLKTGPGKPSFSRGIQALCTVLNRFSVNNRKNMFVYQDNTGHVFYLRLHENVRAHNKLTSYVGRSDNEDNSPGQVSRSSSVASFYARKTPISSNISSTPIIDDVNSQTVDGRPRLRSFGERETVASPAESSTPCVTPQPSGIKPEDTVTLKVHGISEAGPEIKEELVQVLQNRMDDAVLEVLSVMLARNPMCKLTPDDVHFIQKPFHAPDSIIQDYSQPEASNKPSQAVMEFRIWKQGRVNIESLTQKLSAAVRHALWDLLMEYRLLTTPIPELQFFPSSEPTTPNKGKKSMNILEVQQTSSSTIGIKESHSILLPIGREKTETTLHEVYHTIMQPWLDFGVELGLTTIKELIPHSEEGSTCLVLGRNFNQWQACIIDANNYDADILNPKAPKSYQKFSPLLSTQSDLIQFVPRQRFFFSIVTNHQLVPPPFARLSHAALERLLQSLLCSYATERIDTLMRQATSLGQWLSARSCLLSSIMSQKLGLFHNQEIMRERQYANSEKDVFYDNKPGKPMKHLIKTLNMDPVSRNAQQFLRTQQQDRKEEQKKLYVMWQARGATPNIPLAEDIIHLFKQHSRVIHYCLTPLLFLPRWCVQSAATRDHSLIALSDLASSTPLVGSNGFRNHQHPRSPVKSPSIIMAQSSKSPYILDEKWHHMLCANFVQEYKQYLQTLGFIPIHSQPSTPRKGYKGVTTKHRDNNTKASLKEENFTLSFLDECDKMKILMHLHSFTYDYHLRSIHAYVSGRQAFLKQGYHLSRFLDDFLKYYSKAPNFARNLVYADTVSIGNLTTQARQLFNYLLSHEKVYHMEVFRMAPVSHDNDMVKDNEYVLVQLDSTPHMTYHDINDMKHTDDFDVTLIVSHDVDSLEDGGDKGCTKHDQNVLHLKYYIILTSRRRYGYSKSQKRHPMPDTSWLPVVFGAEVLCSSSSSALSEGVASRDNYLSFSSTCALQSRHENVRNAEKVCWGNVPRLLGISLQHQFRVSHHLPHLIGID
uniref:Protein SZT2 n=1 Tax=Timema tahoe TaxID=61484 RepID=A0A7R9IEQ7_9NEOP|nr:unnamed protein product [Timema tahoe]